MKVFVAAHYMLPGAEGRRFNAHEMEVDHTTTVRDFKKTYAETIGKANDIDLERVNLIYNDTVRDDDGPISEAEFESNAPKDRCYVHLQIDNLPWTEEDENLDMNSIFIPLDQVTMKEPPAPKEKRSRKKKNKNNNDADVEDEGETATAKIQEIDTNAEAEVDNNLNNNNDDAADSEGTGSNNTEDGGDATTANIPWQEIDADGDTNARAEVDGNNA